MDKKDLKAQLTDIKSKIKANSKDAHFADVLVAELLSVKGQIDHEPTLVHLPLSDVEDTLEGDTFRIHALKNGVVVYHLKSGYDVVVSSAHEALYETLRQYVLNQSKVDELLPEEDKELYLNDIFATTTILNLATVALSDMSLKYKVYGDILKNLNEWCEKTINEAELQGETPIENESFKKATIGLEELKSEISKL